MKQINIVYFPATKLNTHLCILSLDKFFLRTIEKKRTFIRHSHSPFGADCHHGYMLICTEKFPLFFFHVGIYPRTGKYCGEWVSLLRI